MPSFGVSATSPKNSLLFNMSPTSAIIFIKCPNRCHMKNNIRYEGNTNNTSVIIFLKSKAKNSRRWFSAWENLRGGFRDVDCHFWYSFHFCIFISFLIFILLSFFICRFSSFTFSFQHHHSPFRGLSPGFYTHFILSAQPIAEWFLFIFNDSVIFLLGFWVGVFYPQTFFTLGTFIDILACLYQDLPESQLFFLEVCKASYWSSKHRPGPSVCLIHSNPQSSCSEQFSFKFYQALS